MEILVATRNRGKILELEKLLTGLPLELRSLGKFPMVEDVEETGRTFAENAVLKAKTYAVSTGLWALADDSGLEVAALKGAPGIFSARFGGENATDDQKIRKLLDEMNKSGSTLRDARFVCAMAIADEAGAVRVLAEGVCSGKIAAEPAGTGGFGYDPVFIPEGFDLTFGEISPEIKQKISHRARAVEKIIRFLRDFTLS